MILGLDKIILWIHGIFNCTRALSTMCNIQSLRILEDVNRRRKKDRQYREEKEQKENNDLQSTTRSNNNKSPLKATSVLRKGYQFRLHMCSGRVSSTGSTCGARCVTLVTNR